MHLFEHRGPRKSHQIIYHHSPYEIAIFGVTQHHQTPVCTRSRHCHQQMWWSWTHPESPGPSGRNFVGNRWKASGIVTPKMMEPQFIGIWGYYWGYYTWVSIGVTIPLLGFLYIIHICNFTWATMVTILGMQLYIYIQCQRYSYSNHIPIFTLLYHSFIGICCFFSPFCFGCR